MSLTRKRDLKANLAQMLIGLLCVTITLAVHLYAQFTEGLYQKQSFDVDARRLTFLMKEQIENQVRRLTDLSNFFKSSEDVTKSEFDIFSQDWEETQFSTFGWAPLTTNENLNSLLSLAQKNGINNFKVYDLNNPNTSPQERHFYPFFYIEPLPEFSHLVGLNLLSVPEIKKAIDKQNNSSNLLTTSKFSFGNNNQMENVVAILKPYFKTSSNALPPDGYLVAIISFKKVPKFPIDGWKPETFATTLKDITNNEVLWSYIPSDSTTVYLNGRSPSYQLRFLIGNHIWEISIDPTTDYLKHNNIFLDWLIIPVGLFITLLIILYLRSILKKQQYAEAQVQERTIELECSKKLLARFFENAKDVLCRMSIPDGKIEYISPSIETLTGHSAADFLADGTLTTKVIHPDSLEYFSNCWAKLLRGEVLPFYDYKILTRDGQTKWVHQRTSLVYENNIPVEAENIITDVTELKILEQKNLEYERALLNKQKFESLGVLAEGIAHDFNNLLFAVIGNLELAINEVPKQSSLHQKLSLANCSAQRAANITKQIMAFVGQIKSFIKKVNLSTLITESIDLFNISESGSISLNFELNKNIPDIKGDPQQIQQLLTNLILNAKESLVTNSGNITVSTGCEYLSEESIELSYKDKHLEAGEYCFIAVKDNGCGMDSNTLSHIFEPFFSTKFIGRGLGMSAVFGIIESHNGGIKIESEPGKGTNIRVYFPVFGQHSEDKYQ